MNKEAMGPTGTMIGSVAARLGATLHMKGEITGTGDLVIEGTFEGLVGLEEGELTIETTANVTADIVAADVVMCGNLKGNVRAKDKIEIKKDGFVTGDLIMAQIIIEDGANFKGSIEIKRSAEQGSRQEYVSTSGIILGNAAGSMQKRTPMCRKCMPR